MRASTTAVRLGALLLVLAVPVSSPAATPPGREPAAPAFVYATCGTTGGQTAGTDTVFLGNFEGVIQPLASRGNIASIEPKIAQAGYSWANIDLVEWDPLALAPAAGSIPLRTRSCNSSDLLYGQTRLLCSPPLVTNRSSHVADPPRSTLAAVWTNTYPYPGSGTQVLPFEASGPANEPVARRFWSQASHASVPVAGTHPVMNHTVCLGNPDLQSLHVAQAVTATHAVFDTTYESVAQRFRVAEPVRLRWVELAFATVQNVYPFLPGTVAILDGAGLAVPTATLPGSLVQADFGSTGYWTAGWGSHADFDQVISLEPDHDYWLVVFMRHECGLYTRVRNGTESFDFTSRIGELYARTAAGGAWSLQVDRALSFKIVGEPIGVIGAPSAPTRHVALGVSPNPLRGEATVTWSGSSGRVRYEVLDARGRRVGRGESVAAAAWHWRAVDDRGGALPAGVYFVRATDDAGRRAQSRVVLVR